MTEPDPDPNNYHNPDAETHRFSGLHPDNSYPEVDGQPDEVQQMKTQARQESARTRRVSTDTPHGAHPAFAARFDNDFVKAQKAAAATP